MKDMYAAEGNDLSRRRGAHACAGNWPGRLKDKFAQIGLFWVRAGALVYKLDEGIPVYGIDLQ